MVFSISASRISDSFPEPWAADTTGATVSAATTATSKEANRRMALKESNLPNGSRLTRASRRRNLVAAAFFGAAILSGCASKEVDEVRPGGVFKGAVVADEPLAAQAGMEMLALGGSAADAAVAAYFTLAVTYPSAASLGGGGVCMVGDWERGAVFALDFVAPRSSATDGYRATAVPANVRGMAALHARYGFLDWRTTLSRAEQTARFGEPLTRASAAAYASGGEVLLADGAARDVFAPRGTLPGEGHSLPQNDLADLLSRIRTEGAGSIYEGSAAADIVRAVKVAGGTLVLQDLSNLKPSWQEVAGIPFGNDRVYVAPPPAGAGLIFGQMWQMLAEDKRYAQSNEAERNHLLVEAARAAFAGRARWLADDGTNMQPEDLFSRESLEANLADFNPDRAGPAGNADNGPPRPSFAPASTGVVALDYLGGAVACNFTAYRPFGTGRVAPGTGILLAPSPEAADRNPVSLGPVIVFNPFVRSVKFVGTGGGGADGATALVNVAAGAVIGGGRLDRQIGRPRVHYDGGSTAYIEEAATEESVADLRERGHKVAVVKSLGRVKAIHCPPGYPVEPDKALCLAASDPRGFGLAAFPD